MRRGTRGLSCAAAILGLALSGCTTAPSVEESAEQVTDSAPEPTGPIEIVNAKSLNVRSGPGIEHGIIAKLKSGDSVQVLEEQAGWKRVQAEAGGAVGWVAGRYCKAAE